MTGRQNVAEHVLVSAQQRGVTHVFGVHGANIEDMYDAAARLGMPTVVAKHEFAAGAMADGVARMTDSPSMVITTSGGGSMNVVPALAESYDSRVPVLAVIGVAPTALTARGAFQDMLDAPDTIDLMGVLRSVTGHAELVTHTTELGPALKSAFDTLDRGLPAALVIPKDVQSQSMWESTNQPPPSSGTDSGRIDSGRIDTDELTMLARQLADAVAEGARICLWLGDEASRARVGNTVQRLASRLGATIVASPGGADTTDTRSGHAGITGVMGHPSAREALTSASICVSIGCRMTATDRGGLDPALDDLEIVHIGRHSARPTRGTSIVGSLPNTLSYLDAELERLGVDEQSVPTVGIEYLDTPTVPESRLPHLREIMDTIADALPESAILFADAGNVGAAAIHYLTPVTDGRFTVALGMGGMGYAIAAGIGAAIGPAADGRTVIVAGDGAFFMHGMEFHTAVEYDAPVTLVILNNDAHGMCVTRESLYFPDTPSVNRFRPTDIARGMAAMFSNVEVRHPGDLHELRADAAELFSATGPNALVVDCDPDEIPPFLPFLQKGLR